jgi:hypothetical protein
MEALFAPKHPRHYTGRHRAPRMSRPADVLMTPDDEFAGVR